jgi:hypothetical protein
MLHITFSQTDTEGIMTTYKLTMGEDYKFSARDEGEFREKLRQYNPFLTEGDELRDFSRTMCNWSGKGIAFSDFEGFITTASSAGCMEVCSGQGN